MIEYPDPDATLALAEEAATVSKAAMTTGRVRVRTVNDTYNEIVRASLESDDYEVSRVTIDRQVDVIPTIRTEGDLTTVPVLEEVLFVEKRLVLKEEIHLRRRTSTDTIDTSVTLRRQRAEVDRIDEENSLSQPTDRTPT